LKNPLFSPQQKKCMRIILLIILFSSIHPVSVLSQEQASASEILQQMKRLKVLGSVLYIAAHPDDENTRLLTYFNKELNLRTGYLSITRGDGGQNLIGKEQAEMLGLIRTQELLAARKIDGTQQFFTRANDFGYSKNPEETFRIWNKDTILADMVWVIRKFKPDIIVCRFPTTGEGGHGHHTASAMLALEAFKAAADPTKFPEQLKYVSVWQPRRVFWNTFNFGGNNTTSPDQLKIDVGVFNPLTGKGAGEIAADSRSMHKSQGFGSAKTRGSSIEYFKQLSGDSAAKDLFEGINLSWKRVGAEKFSVLIEKCIANYNPEQPQASIPALVELYRGIERLKASDSSSAFWKRVKLEEIKTLLASCSGLWLEAASNSYYAIPGGHFEVTVQAINRSAADVKLNRISWNFKSDTVTSLTLKPNELYTFMHPENISPDADYSDPFWLKSTTHEIGLYHLTDIFQSDRPENNPAFTVTFFVTVDGLDLQIERPLLYKNVDPIKGEKYRPFEILPFATINFLSKAFVFRNQEPKKILMQLRSNTDSLSGEIQIHVPEGWKADPAIIYFGRMNKDEVISCETTITPLNVNATGKVSASVLSGDRKESKSIFRVDYDHIPQQFMLADAHADLSSLFVTVAGINIGYIPGAGDEIPESLRQLGYQVTMLTQDVLKKSDLDVYDAIVTGIRALNTNEWMKEFNEKLLSYVKDGGNLIMQYNTNNRIGPLTAKIFPYPFTITRERVTDEQATITFALPEHSVLNFPNPISAADFNGWVQERGIYFAAETDTSYKKVLVMNDPGEKPLDGALIACAYGKGNFVYTGLSFFRQLPAGNPGAYRLFVNLLSIPKHQ
jgi:LmbE family N-acetylglucosaminyl deacetylase